MWKMRWVMGVIGLLPLGWAICFCHPHLYFTRLANPDLGRQRGDCSFPGRVFDFISPQQGVVDFAAGFFLAVDDGARHHRARPVVHITAFSGLVDFGRAGRRGRGLLGAYRWVCGRFCAGQIIFQRWALPAHDALVDHLYIWLTSCLFTSNTGWLYFYVIKLSLVAFRHTACQF
jgi:hypothetical protein